MVTMMDSERSGPGVGAALLAFMVFALITAGAFLLAPAGGAPNRTWSAAQIEESPDGGRLEMVTVARRSEHRSEARAFRRAEMVTIAGRGELDLTAVKMAGESGRLEVVVIGGRADVRVPPEWAVETSDSLAAGAIVNRARKAEGEPARRLVLEAVVLGGRLEVSH